MAIAFEFPKNVQSSNFLGSISSDHFKVIVEPTFESPPAFSSISNLVFLGSSSALSSKVITTWIESEPELKIFPPKYLENSETQKEKMCRWRKWLSGGILSVRARFESRERLSFISLELKCNRTMHSPPSSFLFLIIINNLLTY